MAKVGSFAKFGVAVFKASILDSVGDGGSIGQSRFICQVLCSGIQGIYALLMGGPSAKKGSSAKYEHTSKFTLASQKVFLYWYSRHFCSITHRGPFAKVCFSVKFCVLVFKASMLF